MVNPKGFGFYPHKGGMPAQRRVSMSIRLCRNEELMEDEIKTGEALLDYAALTDGISEKIESAYVYLQMGMGAVSEPEIYQGEASEEIILFFSSMLSHLQRLMLFYRTASTYLYKTYMEQYRNDLQIAEWIAQTMEQEQR